MDNSHCGPGSFSPPAPWCDTNTVPEPGTWMLLALGFLVIWAVLRFKK